MQRYVLGWINLFVKKEYMVNTFLLFVMFVLIGKRNEQTGKNIKS